MMINIVKNKMTESNLELKTGRILLWRDDSKSANELQEKLERIGYKVERIFSSRLTAFGDSPFFQGAELAFGETDIYLDFIEPYERVFGKGDYNNPKP